MMTEISHLTAYQQSLFLFLVNGGTADIQVKCNWGWVDIRGASLECVGQQYHLEDGTIETNMFVHRDHTIVHHDRDALQKIAMDFPTRFTMEAVLSSDNHYIDAPTPADVQ